MTIVQELLRSAGIGFAAAEEHPDAHVECARMARLLRERASRAVGLVPAGDDVAVPSLAIALGRALASREAAVGVLDAAAGWPCAEALRARAVPYGTEVATSWVVENLAVLTPRAADAGELLSRLRGALVDKGAIFGHLVVDLTGFGPLGEHVGAYALMDAVALVARSGRTTTRQVERWLRDFPEGRSLGVLLTGV
jgi:hypothetical protein